ncbi:MAG TPA: three-Cys-motif partner protein TcmP [Candidatus Limnocylindrales bacterium]|nr:three-Cys-motif partner protein TcmP [Candidatus Limnocylindrales bacterium]
MGHPISQYPYCKIRTYGFFPSLLGSQESREKTAIVTKYFDAWQGVIVPPVKKFGGSKIGYVDLFAGPGVYDDGTESTPIKILKKAIADPDLRSMLVFCFNDVNPDFAGRLEKQISSIPEIKKLKTKPVVWNQDVGEKIAQMFSAMKVLPIM